MPRTSKWIDEAEAEELRREALLEAAGFHEEEEDMHDNYWLMLYRAYKDLRKNSAGQLVANIVSNDTAKVMVYRSALAKYRNEYPDEKLNDILKMLSDEFAEEYEEELQNR